MTSAVMVLGNTGRSKRRGFFATKFLALDGVSIALEVELDLRRRPLVFVGWAWTLAYLWNVSQAVCLAWLSAPSYFLLPLLAPMCSAGVFIRENLIEQRANSSQMCIVLERKTIDGIDRARGRCTRAPVVMQWSREGERLLLRALFGKESKCGHRFTVLSHPPPTAQSAHSTFS